MKDMKERFGANRRGFLHKAAGSIAGAALVTILPARETHAAETKPCSPEELEQLKSRLHDTQFSSAVSTARYVKQLHDKFGPGVIEIVKNTTIESARKQTEKMSAPKEQRNLKGIKAFYASFPQGDVTYTWVEDTPERLKANVTRCRWAEEFKKAGMPGGIGFALVCSYDYGFCAAFNSDMKFTRTKTIMQGDDHCDHTYELKS